MHYDELTPAQRSVVHDTLAGHHHRELEAVVIRRRDNKPVASLTNQLLGGNIQGDVDRTPTTTLECTIYDDDYVLDWANGEHRHFRIQIIDRRFIPDFDDWVEQEIHTGPLWTFSRTGPAVHLVVEGPEMDAMGSVRAPASWPARTQAVRVIRELLTLSGAAGRDLSIPPSKHKLPQNVTIGVRRGKDDQSRKPERGPKRQVLRATREQTYYGVLEPIPEAIDRELYTDGRGRFLLRKPATRTSLELSRSMLVGEVVEKPAQDGEEPVNTWHVRGANPKGPRDRVAVKVSLPDTHPSSSWARRWNGVRREVAETLENKHLRTNAAALRAGERRRDRRVREPVSFEIEALPVVMWLRPNALIGIPTSRGRGTTRVKRWTIPLGPDADPLRIGVNRRRGWRG